MSTRIAQRRILVIWRFYRISSLSPASNQAAQDGFRHASIASYAQTGFVTLDRLLARLHANKANC